MTSTRLPISLLLAASVIVLGTALLSQFAGGLQPCELCLYERWPYDAMIVLALLALVSGKAVRMIVLVLAALIFAGSSILSAYHVAIEQHWIEGPTACTGDVAANSPEALLRSLQGREPVLCDVVQWSFHGISLAGLNLAVSLVLCAFAIWALMRSREAER